MSESTTTAEAKLPWWRERWVSLAAIVMAAQVFAFRAVSPDSVRRPRVYPDRQDVFVTASREAVGGSPLEAWSWLMTPAVFLLPAAEDFSGLAWLQSDAGGLEAEVLEMPSRPLHWVGREAGLPAELGLRRAESGMANRWLDSMGGLSLPVPGPLPMPASARLRVVAGLRDRPIRVGGEAGSMPEPKVVSARPVVVQVSVDANGDLADPPIVWEPSDVPAADEAALAWARRLAFSRSPDGRDRESGLLVVEWGAPTMTSARSSGSAEP